MSITTPSQLLLPRLEGVVPTGKGWRAYCPCCGGRSRKLSVTEGDNGTLLVTCFSCHDTPAILAALGMQMGDLFQRRDLRTMTRVERKTFMEAAHIPRWLAALNVLTNGANFLLIAADKMGDGEALTANDQTQLRVKALLIFDALEVLNAR